MSNDLKNSEKSRPRPKKIILVDRDLQFRYARLGMGVGLLSTAFTAFMVLYPLYYFNILVIPNFLPTPILTMIVSALVINMLLVGFFGILISHRIAGPIFAMVRHFRTIQDGRFNIQITLREDDDLKYLAKHFNETCESLRNLARDDLDQIDQVIKGFQGKSEVEQLVSLEQLKLRIAKRLS